MIRESSRGPPFPKENHVYHVINTLLIPILSQMIDREENITGNIYEPGGINISIHFVSRLEASWSSSHLVFLNMSRTRISIPRQAFRLGIFARSSGARTPPTRRKKPCISRTLSSCVISLYGGLIGPSSA